MEKNDTINNQKEEKHQKDAKTEKTDPKLKTEKREFKGDGYSFSYEVITEGGGSAKEKIQAHLTKSLAGDGHNYKNIEDFEQALKSKEYGVKSEYCENASREFNSHISMTGKVVSLTVNEYTFECGAHGNGYTSVKHFHLNTGKEITLEDILKDKKRFTNQVEKQFCADTKLEKNNSAYVNAGYEGFAGGFDLAKNYSFTKNGIIFIYNSYEVGPYTLPPFDVTVTYDKVKPYMKEDNPLGI
jgi:hypothetical protein